MVFRLTGDDTQIYLTKDSVKAVDDVDSDVTGVVKVSGDTVDTSKPGAYTLVYTVSDAAGSEASVTRVATVKEKSGETPVEPGDKDPDGGKEPGKDTDKDGDKAVSYTHLTLPTKA